MMRQHRFVTLRAGGSFGQPDSIVGTPRSPFGLGFLLFRYSHNLSSLRFALQPKLNYHYLGEWPDRSVFGVLFFVFCVKIRIQRTRLWLTPEGF